MQFSQYGKIPYLPNSETKLLLSELYMCIFFNIYINNTSSYQSLLPQHLHFPVKICMTKMSRKIQRTTCKDGYRRSPRLCTLDAWNKDAQKSTHITDHPFDNDMGPSFRSSRGRNKTSNLSPVEELDKESPNREDHSNNSDQPLVLQAKDKPKNEDEAVRNCQQSIMSFAPRVPAKHILEFIIDILQRRDTHEIFAEPVDPNEVEDYYEIIDEPMDFGTMRAKLHEGMYNNLEQFEHDVFLISRNAMHFNSSGTMYFRQARAIHELSKKVFHVLKTEPEKLESEFSLTRRRPGRKPRAEATFSLCPKRDLNPRSSNLGIDLSLKSVPCSLSRSSKSRRNFRVTRGGFDRATPINTSDKEIISGAKDSRWSSSVEEDRRGTYRPWMAFNNENNSIFSTTYSNPKSLMHVNQQDFDYTESLMLFSKDLGPTAQMVAKRKLQACLADPPDCQTPLSNCYIQVPKFQNPAGSSSTQWRTCTSGIGIMATTSQNLFDCQYGYPTGIQNIGDCSTMRNAGRGEKPCMGDGTDTCGAPVHMAHNNSEKSTLSVFRGESPDRNGMNVLGIFRGDMVYQNDNARNQLDSDYPTAGFGDSKFADVGNKNTNDNSRATTMDVGKLDTLVQPSKMGSEYSQSNVSNLMGRNMNSSASSSWPLKTIGVSSLSQTKATMHDFDSQSPPCPSNGFRRSSQTGQVLELNQPMPLVSKYTFNLPYLKSRLNQMSSLGQDRYLRQCSSTKEPFFDKVIDERVSNHQVELGTQFLLKNEQRSSLDSRHTNLALQL